jgi:hypothetical protein
MKSLKVNFFHSQLFALNLSPSLRFAQKRKKIFRIKIKSFINKVPMKTSYFFILIFFLITDLQAQWSTNPNSNLIVGYGLDPHICSDSAGGCYVTYDYNSTTYPRWLALERLNKYGYKPWGTLKQILGELPEQSHAEIIEDGEGGVIVSYEDRFEDLPNTAQRVRVQRVDSNGNFLWGQTGVKVTLDEINHGKQQLVTDGSGGAVVVWVNTFDQYKVNRISSEGQRMWGDSGLMLTSGSNEQPIIVNAADGNYYLQAATIIYRINQNGEILNQFSSTTFGQPVPDPEGGVVVSSRVWTGMIVKLVAQRKDALGNNLWPEPYVEIADSLDIGTSLNILSENNYYHFGWLGRKNGTAEILQIQSLRNDGSKLFLSGSVSLSNLPTSVTSIPIISSFNGSNIYAWTHWESPQTFNANFARRIDSTGTDLWQTNTVLLNEPYLGYFSMTTDCAGGAVGVGYMNSDFAIRALKVSVNGNLGEVISGLENSSEELPPVETILYQNYPNPFNSTTNIKYQVHREGRIRIKLYNALGEELKIISNEYKSIGTYSLTFNSNELPSGVYLYAMQTDSEEIVKKLIILK